MLRSWSSGTEVCHNFITQMEVNLCSSSHHLSPLPELVAKLVETFKEEVDKSLTIRELGVGTGEVLIAEADHPGSH